MEVKHTDGSSRTLTVVQAAHIVAEMCLTVGITYVVQGRHILVAVGGYPVTPAVEGEGGAVMLLCNAGAPCPNAHAGAPCPYAHAGADLGITSDGFFELEELPRKVRRGGWHR